MADAIQVQMARMMKWHGRASSVLAVYLLLLFAPDALRHILQEDVSVLRTDSPLTILLVIAAGLAFVAATIVVLIEMWHVFQAGRLAFGIWSGVIYASLTWVLPGPFVIPHMVRLDVKRLLDLELQGDRC
jgi:hypothetical protein